MQESDFYMAHLETDFFSLVQTISRIFENVWKFVIDPRLYYRVSHIEMVDTKWIWTSSFWYYEYFHNNNKLKGKFKK